MNRSFYICCDNTDAISENLSFENFFEEKIVVFFTQIHKPARKQTVEKQNLKLNCKKLQFLQICSSIQRSCIMHEVMFVLKKVAIKVKDILLASYFGN
ncbi:hypothetical protein T06_12844 [Trichinella sp. T6]|nr:hypothetical protein T06_12844 [Trichinella sp. T6]